jgi:hypothetical protein
MRDESVGTDRKVVTTIDCETGNRCQVILHFGAVDVDPFHAVRIVWDCPPPADEDIRSLLRAFPRLCRRIEALVPDEVARETAIAGLSRRLLGDEPL